ncbi:hypothetical protein QBC38DRAFT_464483 [Podospora fimiseda]|uniref:F-box protein n=1 Tax=Podospora fimiseda TaxID=252190 RepID=A0AAN7BZ47_9PEZI|nr:hypothetical protein QBC38DRAFT_464483 [Podospora fimiseda]
MPHIFHQMSWFDFAKACPNLTKVQIRGTEGLEDRVVRAFLLNCPKLKHLEIVGYGSRQDNAFSKTCLDFPDDFWNDNTSLKELVISSGERGFEDAMQEYSKEHVDLTIKLMWPGMRIMDMFKKRKLRTVDFDDLDEFQVRWL